MVNTPYNFYPLQFAVDYTSSLLTPKHKPIAENTPWPRHELHSAVHQLRISSHLHDYNPVFVSQNKGNQGHSGQQRAGESLDSNRKCYKHTLLHGVSNKCLLAPAHFQPYSPSSQGTPSHLRFVEYLCLTEQRAHHNYASLKASVPSSCLRDDSQHR